MPELPEVETVVRDLRKKIVGKKILEVLYCDEPKIIRGMAVAIFKKKIIGQKIEKVERRAKNIFMYLSGGRVLHIHLKMTGHLLISDCRFQIADGKWVGEGLPKELEEKVNQFIHLVLELSGRTILAYSDMRKFGFWHLTSKAHIEAVVARHGPEPLDDEMFTLATFRAILRASGGKIKQTLLDQSKIAGIGNIYGDEILFLAGVMPTKIAKKLRNKEIEKIYYNIRPTLEKAIKMRGASIGDFRDTAGKKGYYQESRLVYGREGLLCLQCGGKIKRIKIAGRSSCYCPKCQR
ncbi:bifunctional DNA-formamidopyrimidine glycosylase/DNA-(apurinic or apyrimidinic site) lyase [Candidatus Microgenomates bacterium]|nr:bifunctional DNA-formamidopyrimidine glycosylase/DNA-(apurinic or apyrimidinic site) lyase [Candidatus Microgenomates bacterium]